MLVGEVILVADGIYAVPTSRKMGVGTQHIASVCREYALYNEVLTEPKEQTQEAYTNIKHSIVIQYLTQVCYVVSSSGKKLSDDLVFILLLLFSFSFVFDLLECNVSAL